MRVSQLAICGLGAAFFVSVTGCAINPQYGAAPLEAPIAERDMLAEAAAAVEAAPWPKPQEISFISRITGGGDPDRVKRSDAIDAYLVDLMLSSPPFARLQRDAYANLAAADHLNQSARQALYAVSLSMNDVAIIESAMRTLRDHRDIYSSAAKELKKTGAAIDEDRLDEIRDAYGEKLKSLGDAADMLADRIDDDHSKAFAAPGKPIKRRFGDL